MYYWEDTDWHLEFNAFLYCESDRETQELDQAYRQSIVAKKEAAKVKGGI